MQITLPRIGTVAAWRQEVRRLAAAGVDPQAVIWSVGTAAPDLFATAPPAPGPSTRLMLSREAVDGIEMALMHADPERFSRAHALVLRLSRRELRWGDRSDPMMQRVLDQQKAVGREIHKMHGFVRFRDLTPPGANRRAFAAWFEPDHPILEAAAPFFSRRFGDMDWLIATPTLTARCEAGTLRIEETAARPPPAQDATEELWRVYFAAIFNPARLMVTAMKSHMPQKYWKNLPEAELIPGLIRSAETRVRAMHDPGGGAPEGSPGGRLRRKAAARRPEAG